MNKIITIHKSSPLHLCLNKYSTISSSTAHSLISTQQYTQNITNYRNSNKNMPINMGKYMKINGQFGNLNKKLMYLYWSDNKNKYQFGDKNKSNNDSEGSQNKSSQQKTEKQNNPNPKQDSNPSQTQSQTLQKIEQQMFNRYLRLPKNHSFKSDLIIAQQNYKKSINQLKQAILFEDLLKKQIDIEIYNTQGKPFYKHLWRCFFMFIVVIGGCWSVWQTFKLDKKFKVIIQKTAQGKVFLYSLIFMCIFIYLRILLRHARLTKRYVQKIVYNTETQQFTLTKRSILGKKYKQQVSRFRILYTENPVLNRKGTNYINIENYEEYQIGYGYAWKKEDLWSHLISQRIKT